MPNSYNETLRLCLNLVARDFTTSYYGNCKAEYDWAIYIACTVCCVNRKSNESSSVPLLLAVVDRLILNGARDRFCILVDGSCELVGLILHLE